MRTSQCRKPQYAYELALMREQPPTFDPAQGFKPWGTAVDKHRVKPYAP